MNCLMHFIKLITDRVRSTTEGYVLQVSINKGDGGITAKSRPGIDTPRYLFYLPGQFQIGEGVRQGTYPTPRPGQDGGGVPQGTYPPGQGTYLLARFRQGRGCPRYLPPPRIGQHMEYLILEDFLVCLNFKILRFNL